MTFAARTFGGLGYSFLPGSAAIFDTRLTPAACSGSLVINANGTLSVTGNGSTAPARWHSDPGTPGSYVWAKWTDTTGQAALFGYTAGTLYSLASGMTIGWFHNSGTYIAAGSGTVSFYANAAGTQLLGTISLNIDVESS